MGDVSGGRGSGRPLTDLRYIKQVLDHYDQTGSVLEAEKAFGVNHTTVYRWLDRRKAAGYQWPDELDIREQQQYLEQSAARRERAVNVARRYRRRRYLAGQHLTVDALGTVRRIRALHCLGWSQRALAERLGVSAGRVGHMTIAKYPRVNIDTATKVAALYEELCMTLPPETQFTRRMRNYARKQGWAPPLAWDDIDDPDEQPSGLIAPKRTHVPRAELEAARVQQLRDLIARQATVEAACREIGVDREALWKWCDRHGYRDLYGQLYARTTNQHRTSKTPGQDETTTTDEGSAA